MTFNAFDVALTGFVIALVYALIMSVVDVVIDILERRRRTRGPKECFDAFGVERIHDSRLKNCAYCGLPLIIEHQREEWLQDPDFYVVEHEDLMAAAKAECPTLYASFGSVEEAIEKMNRRTT